MKPREGDEEGFSWSPVPEDDRPGAPAEPPPEPAPAPSAEPAPTFLPPQPPVPVAPPSARPAGLEGQELAAWWPRVMALSIDGIIGIVGVALLAAIGAAAASADSGANATATGIAIVASPLIVPFIYTAPMLASTNGQTLGKRAMRIRVIREGGEEITYGHALLREWVAKVLAIQVIGGFLLAPPVLDAFWPIWDAENRSLHDMMAETRVVRAVPT
jgi:uncharacterized RDD family membrane protein YckC